MSGRPEPKFYQRGVVSRIAEQLLGKLLVTSINGLRSSGIIVETEAYSFREKGCHAYQNKMTRRNEAMFLPGGHAYVYLCYGIHYMFNVVTNVGGRGDAVLIRAVEACGGYRYYEGANASEHRKADNVRTGETGKSHGHQFESEWGEPERPDCMD
jgi:DNA-3-methyladenine glycosylase